MSLLVLSPHLDDAALSCASLIAASDDVTVVTLFAGRPPDGRLSDWDRLSFGPGDDPMRQRQAEDRRALRTLGAAAVHLDHIESAYGAVDDEALRNDIRSCLQRLRPSQVLIPLGLGHPNHVQAQRASWPLLAEFTLIEWLLYAELPYAVEAPEVLRDRLAMMERECGELSELSSARRRRRGRKVIAICLYRSQVHALGRARLRRALNPERYWRVRP